MSEIAATAEQAGELELVKSSPGDTIALVFNRTFTPEQYHALVEVFWAFHPTDWPDGQAVVFPSGLEVTVKVAK